MFHYFSACHARNVAGMFLHYSVIYHVQRHGLVGARHEDHDLSGVHHGADADRQGLLRHLLHVVVEKTRVGVDRLLDIVVGSDDNLLS